MSSADRVGRTGHGQLIGTAITLALVGARDKGHLAVPLRQRFTLGTTRLELIPSGRGFGAAALHVDIAGRTVLYAGAVRTSAGGVGDAAELRTCDAVVVAAAYGAPHHRFPPLGGAIASTIEWTRDHLAAGRRPILFVDTLLDGLEVASRLAAEGIAIAGPRPLREAAQRIADLVPSPQRIDGAIAIGSTLPIRSLGRDARDAEALRPRTDGASGIPVIAAPGRELRAIVWLDADRAGLARALGDRRTPGHDSDRIRIAEHDPHGDRDTDDASRAADSAVRGDVTALVSARAFAGWDGHDAGFVWAAAADHLQLLGWIEATGARDVFVTGPCAEAVVAALGRRARLIGPPHQMSLFPGEAFP